MKIRADSMSNLIPLALVLERHKQERARLQVELTAEALDLAAELWPQGADGGVYLTAHQWFRLRRLLLGVPDLGD